MKKIVLMVIFCSFAFGQSYHIQSMLSVKDGIKITDFEKAMMNHNKSHKGLAAVNTFSVVNGPNAGKYVRVAAAQWPTPLDMVDSVFDSHSNHEPVPYDKWGSMFNIDGGMEFWTVRPDLSRNMPTVEGADVNGEQPKFITIYYYGVQQGGNANTEAIFSRFNEIAIQSDSARPWVAMTKTLGGNVSVYSYSTPHMTMSEVLAPAQAEFATVLAQMYAEDSDLDTKVRNGWSWIWSETWRFRPELSTVSN
jgi:hypothetical protein